MSKEIRFATEQEAMQYLADVTGKQIKIAKEEDPMDVYFDEYEDERDPYEYDPKLSDKEALDEAKSNIDYALFYFDLLQEDLDNTGKKHKNYDELVKIIAKDPKVSFNLVKDMVRRKREVPAELEKGISLNLDLAEEYAKILKQLNQPVPQVIKEALYDNIEMSFTGSNEAIQYLSDITGKRIKIAKSLIEKIIYEADGLSYGSTKDESEDKLKDLIPEYIKEKIETDNLTGEQNNFILRNFKDHMDELKSLVQEHASLAKGKVEDYLDKLVEAVNKMGE
jgi:hypothetical protein